MKKTLIRKEWNVLLNFIQCKHSSSLPSVSALLCLFLHLNLQNEGVYKEIFNICVSIIKNILISKDRSCFGSTPSLSLENILRKVRCVLACCGGKVIIQNSELDGGEE